MPNDSKITRLAIIAVAALAWSSLRSEAQLIPLNIGRNPIGTVSANAGGSYTVVGGGNDIWDNVDEFTYAYQEVTGDFDVRVRVQSLSPNAPWSKAGLMVRESVAEDSRMVFERVTPPNVPTAAGGNGVNDVHWSYRTGRHINDASGNGDRFNDDINDGRHEEGSGSPAYPNAWVRVVRQGGALSGYLSSNGINWMLQGTQNSATWPGGSVRRTLLVGLGVARHSGGPTATAEFRDFQLTQPTFQADADSRGNPNGIRVVFNRPAGANALNLGNYTLTGGTGQSINSAAAGPSSNIILLQTGTLVEGATYTLTVRNVLDAGGNSIGTNAVSFVHAQGMEARRIHVLHNQAPNGWNANYAALSDYYFQSTAYNLGLPVAADDQPAQTGNTLFEDNTPDDDFHESYVTRIAGVFTAPGDGNYQFACASDDGGALFLSSDDGLVNKLEIAREPEWGGSRVFADATGDGSGRVNANRGPAGAGVNLSAPIALLAGKNYYLEYVAAEGGGGNHSAVAWDSGTGSAFVNGQSPMDESLFSPSRFYRNMLFYNLGPVAITQPPQNTTTLESQTATFGVGVDGTPMYTYQWYRNGKPIAGANGARYTTSALTAGNAGDQYRVVVSNEFSSATSSVATLTVINSPSPPVTIPDNGSATPYPSSIAISNIAGTVWKVTVTLNNLSHTYADDLDLLLVGPGGQSVLLMSDAGGGFGVNNVTITFDDAAAAPLPDGAQLVSAAYQPANYGTGDAFPAPAPAGPYGTTLSVFNGVNPNGTWQLYLFDDAGGDSGAIAGGWSLAIDATPANDDFTNRIVLSGSTAAAAGSNIGATKEPGEPNHAGNIGGKSVWWNWTAPASGTVRIDTMGSSVDTLLGVYTGTGVSNLAQVAADDDGGGSLSSLVSFQATAGVTYEIAVDGYDGASGSINLSIAPDAPILTGVSSRGNPVAIYVFFSRNMDSGTALDRARYSVGNGITVNSASFVPSFGSNGLQSVVWLDISPALAEGASYSVQVSNVTDTIGNIVIPNPSTVSFLHGLDTCGLHLADFNSDVPPDASLFGNAMINGGVLKLTVNANGQSGSYLVNNFNNNRPIDRFHASFKAYVGGGTVTPADGFSFSFANDLPNGPFGEEGAGSGLRVAFDSFDNGGGEAPAIDVYWNNVVIGHVLTPVSQGPTGNGFFDVLINMDPDGALDVSYNHVPIYWNFPTPFTPMAGRFGLGARTGGLNDNHWFDDLRIASFENLGPVSIVGQPQSLTTLENATATFRALADGTPCYAFQWSSNGVPISGATNLSYSTTATLALSGTRYRVVVRNEFSSSTSVEAVLTVLPPPVVTGVSVAGNPNAIYVFFSKNMGASALNPANYSVDNGITVNSVQAASALAGNLPQSVVCLNVTPALTAGTTYNVTIQNAQDDTALMNPIVPNPTLMKFVYGTESTDYGFSDFSGSTLNGILLGNARVDSGILKLTDAVNGQVGTFILGDFNHGLPIQRFTARFKALVGGGTSTPADGFGFNFGQFNDLPVGEEGIGDIGGQGLTVTFDSYDNGGGEAPAIDVKWNGSTIGHVLTTVSQGPLGTNFLDVSINLDPDGTLDVSYNDVAIYSNLATPFTARTGRFALGARTGGLNDNHWIKDLEVSATTPSAATIVSQPQDRAVVAGANVTFSVTAAGTGPLNYQWRFNGANIPGAMDSTLVLSNAQTNSAGNYSVVVSNLMGTTTSVDARLTVVPAGAVLTGTEQFNFTTLAGPASGNGYSDGLGSAARFNHPYGVSVDTTGNVYVADYANQTIRKITPGGEVSTLAGLPGNLGCADGTGSAARFYLPSGVAVDSADNVYVADLGNYTIRKVAPGGVVSTLAGLAGSFESIDGAGSAARFWSPHGVAADSAGNLYVVDNSTIRRIAPGGVVSTIAGLSGSFGTNDGQGSLARFGSPNGLAVDGAGNVYVADTFNHTIRRITSGGIVSTLVGSAGSLGSADGVGSAARFFLPEGIAADSAGNLYVGDTYSHTIRKITPTGTDWVVSTLAGLPGVVGSEDGIGGAARFFEPRGVTVDSFGNIYVADSGNFTIRKITPVGTNWVVSTLAGLAGDFGSPGSTDGTASTARFDRPFGVGVDSVGNVYVADRRNYTIRKLTPGGEVSTLAGLAGYNGSDDGTGSAARFGGGYLDGPSDVATDIAGNVFVADPGSQTIRKITVGGEVTTLAGLAGDDGSRDGTGSEARFNFPRGVAVDSVGNLYVADCGNQTIRKITFVGTNWVVSTLAGQVGQCGSDDGTGSAARFCGPEGVAVDGVGNVYVADTLNQTIRKITPIGTNWVVSTLAGQAGSFGSTDGTGSDARFGGHELFLRYGPTGLTVDSAGNVYVADTYNSTIRRITPGGVVSTLAGLAGYFGTDDGAGSAARFYLPYDVALDGAGNLYVADTFNHKIRLGTPILINVTRQPTGRTVLMGAMASLNVEASGRLPLSYQWRFNGGDLWGATNAALTLNNVTINQAGEYLVVISSAAGSVTSSVAVLTVVSGSPGLSIDVQPQSQTVNPGTTVTLGVGASGNPSPIYQWRRNGVNIPGAVYPTLTLTDVQPTDGGSYSVVVANLVGAISSDVAQLVVTSPALPLADNFAGRFTTNSFSGVGSGSNTNATKEIGETNHVGKAGGKSVWIAWQAPANGIATFSTLGSSFDTLLAVYTGSSLSNLTDVASDDDRGGFLTSQVAFKAVAGTVYSIAMDGFGGRSGHIVLSWNLDTTFSDLPRFTAHPLSQTVTNGANVSLSVVVVSQTAERYQWFYNCDLIPSTNNPTATNATLLVSNVQPALVGSYTVRVRNATNREVESLPAFLEIGPEKDALSQDKLADLLAQAHQGPIPQSVTGRLRPHDFPTVVAGTLGTQILNNFGATTEGGETNHAGVIGGASRWFLLTAQASGPMMIDTIGSDIDTVLAVYTGTDLLNLALIASDDNGAPDGIRSRAQFTAVAGTDYLIAVDGVGGAQGTIQLNWSLGGPPVLLNLESSPLSYMENQAATALTASLIVNDPDDSALTGASVQITGNYMNGQDVLGFVNTANISGSFDTASGRLTLSGTDTLANYETALRSVTYRNSSDNPSTLVRTFTFLASAAGDISVSVTRTVNVTAVNDAPTLTAVNPLTGATEDTAFTIGYAALAAAADEGDVDSASVSFQVESVSSGTLTKGGAAVTPGATLLSNGENWVWTPATNANGTLNAFTVRAWDGSLASASAVPVQVTVAAVNDAPTLAALGPVVLNEGAGLQTVNLSGISAGPADESGQVLTVTATSSMPGLILDPTVNYANPSATGSLGFTPVAQSNGTATITVVVRDNGGTANAGADAVTNSFAVTVWPRLRLDSSGGTSVLFTNGSFRLLLNVGQGQTVVIQGSTNLNPNDWISVYTNTGTNGPMEFRDTNALNYQRRFYRAVQGP